MVQELGHSLGWVDPGVNVADPNERVRYLQSLFSHDQSVALVPGARDDRECLLCALDDLSESAPRHRQGAPPVRQRIDSRFVKATLSEWARDDQQRFIELQRDGLLDRMVGRNLLTAADAKSLRLPPDLRLGLTVPTDFCDDSKTGRDLGLTGDLASARKVCYGIFRAQFPESSIDATDPALWHDRCPQFWLSSTVPARSKRTEGGCEYETGVLEEIVNLPNYLKPFGPVKLNFVRTTAVDKTWSFVTYRLANQDMLPVDQGWYLVQRRPGRVSAAVMVKMVEFYGDNDWLDVVCDAGLLDGGRELLGVDEGGGGNQAGSMSPTAQFADTEAVGVDQPLSRVVFDYLDSCRRECDDRRSDALNEIRNGVAKFESQPLSFGWIDNMFGVIGHSTSYFSAVASDWADVVQKDLPQALEQAEAVRAAVDGGNADVASDRVAHLMLAGWKTALGMYRAGSDASRAMLQVLGPGISKSDTTIVDGLGDLAKSGELATFLQEHAVTDIGAATRKLFTKAPWAQSVADLDTDLDGVIRAYGTQQPTASTRTPFAQEVWARGQKSRRRRAGR